MNEHSLVYFPYASFTNAQLPLLKVAALYFDKLVLLDPVGASWDTVDADHIARDAVRLLTSAGILEAVTPATVLAKYERPIAEAVRRDMADHEFLDLCDAQSQASGKQRWTLSLAKVPQDLQTDQAMRHLMGDIARKVARDSGQSENARVGIRASTTNTPRPAKPTTSTARARATASSSSTATPTSPWRWARRS